MKVSRVRALVLAASLAVASVVAACAPPPDPGPVGSTTTTTALPGPNGVIIAAPDEVVSSSTNGKRLLLKHDDEALFVWDRAAGTVVPVPDTVPSTTAGGIRGADPQISGDGTKVAWTGYFDGSVSPPRYGVTPAFADLTTGQARVMPTPGIDMWVNYTAVAMPDDGSFVVVERKSLIPDDYTVEIAVWNTVANTVTYTGLTASQTYTSSGQTSVSNDGRYVQFERNVWDRQTGEVTAVTAPNATGYDNVGLNGSGRLFAFNSESAGGGYTTARPAIWDRETNMIRHAPLGADGQPYNAQTYIRGISDDGAVALLYSGASNVVAGDTNGRGDTFIWDLNANTVRRLAPGDSDSYAGWLLSGNGRVVAGLRYAADFSPVGPFVWTE